MLGARGWTRVCRSTSSITSVGGNVMGFFSRAKKTEAHRRRQESQSSSSFPLFPRLTRCDSQDLLSVVTSNTGADSTNTWMLRASLYVTNGVTLEIKGTAAGGDCDEVQGGVVVTSTTEACRDFLFQFVETRNL